MAVGRAARRTAREGRVATWFGDPESSTVLDLFELLDLAWHDCYSELCPPDDVLDDVLVVSQGDLRRLIEAARLAVVDFRDLRLAADSVRG